MNESSWRCLCWLRCLLVSPLCTSILLGFWVFCSHNASVNVALQSLGARWYCHPAMPMCLWRCLDVTMLCDHSTALHRVALINRCGRMHATLPHCGGIKPSPCLIRMIRRITGHGAQLPQLAEACHLLVANLQSRAILTCLPCLNRMRCLPA